MSEMDDIDAIAGEYVLGTLDADERADVTARRAREPALDNAIRAWEQRLSPLDQVTASDPAEKGTLRVNLLDGKAPDYLIPVELANPKTLYRVWKVDRTVLNLPPSAAAVSTP